MDVFHRAAADALLERVAAIRVADSLAKRIAPLASTMMIASVLFWTRT
jgi:hypothetical protein